MNPADPSPADLWKAILTAPADADLKARYAEALTKAGDWRADVFSAAAEYDRLDHDQTRAECAAFKPRFDALIARRRADFVHGSDPWPDTIQFVLGWPIELTIAARDFARVAPDAVATVPVRHLNLRAVSQWPAVFDIPQLDQIVSIDGSDQAWSDDAIRALAGSRHLQALRWLRLSRAGITEEQVEVLAASQSLKDVRVLDLTNNPTRDPVDAASGHGIDWMTNTIVPESIFLPAFGKELEDRYGTITWLHGLENYMGDYPPSRYGF